MKNIWNLKNKKYEILGDIEIVRITEDLYDGTIEVGIEGKTLMKVKFEMKNSRLLKKYILKIIYF